VRSTIIKLQKQESADALEARQQRKPFYIKEFDFVLKPLKSEIAPNSKNAATIA
jgi:hypothetical protein